MLVKELMVTDVRTCGPDDTLEAAGREMWARNCGCLPVVDEHLNVLGIITERDVLMSAWLNPVGARSSLVGSAMSQRIPTCCPEDDIQLAHQQMRAHRVRRLAVTAGTRLVGILSLSDLVLDGLGTMSSHRPPLTRDGFVPGRDYPGERQTQFAD